MSTEITIYILLSPFSGGVVKGSMTVWFKIISLLDFFLNQKRTSTTIIVKIHNIEVNVYLNQKNK